MFLIFHVSIFLIFRYSVFSVFGMITSNVYDHKKKLT